MQFLPKKIIISRTDSIGDVVLTLPMAAVLKKYFPDTVIAFLGRAYTQPVISACKFVDDFIDVNDFMKHDYNAGAAQVIIHVFPTAAIARQAKALGIPLRIGTTNRLYHWWYCNKLVRLSRKNANLHEAQLNLKLLQPFNIPTQYSLAAIAGLYGLENLQPLQQTWRALLKKDAYNLILHPKSQGSGREWPLEYYIRLIQLLDASRYNIFISGTKTERSKLAPLFEQVGHLVNDVCGQMSLDQFISFIKACNGLVASGTGPVHLAAALGIDALGIYPPIKPIHPQRWQPVGYKARVFVSNKTCNDCKSNVAACSCITEVQPETLKAWLDAMPISIA